MALRILNVGQCGFDGPNMKRVFEERLKAVVDKADSGEEALEKLSANDYDIVLVNRLLARGGGSGHEVISQLKAANDDVPVLLVSDLADAQAEAVELGAEPGFGKSDLESDETLRRLKAYARSAKT